MVSTLTFCALLACQAESGNQPAQPALAIPREARIEPVRSGVVSTQSGIESATPLPATLQCLKPWGVRFRGSPEQLRTFASDLIEWLQSEMHWGTDVAEVVLSERGDFLDLRMKSRPWETSTLLFARRTELDFRDETMTFTNRSGRSVAFPLVSQKEVLASLMARGRLTEFPPECCSIDALCDHIELRRSIVRWSLRADFAFPYSGSAVFPGTMWTADRCVRHGYTSREAVADLFLNPKPYVIGCRTNCKAKIAQGVFDFAAEHDPELLRRLELLAAGDPLGRVTPQYGGPDGNQLLRQGTLLDAVRDCAWNNWIPGDWGYVRNTDLESQKENGNEGHNMIYLGRGLFAPNYRSEGCITETDRPLEKVLYYVYSWRASRDMHPESDGLIRQLAETPEYGGLLEDHRLVPKIWPRRPPAGSIAQRMAETGIDAAQSSRKFVRNVSPVSR